MHPELVHLRLVGGERVVHTYGALLVVAVAAGIGVTVARARRFGLQRFDALALGLFGIVGGLVGATLLNIVVQWRLMLHDPSLLLRPGLVFYGGFIGGAALALTYCRIYKISGWSAADCAAPGLALGHAIGRVGCFCAGCCYGKPVADFPLAVTLDGVSRHPVQLYEAAGLAVIALTTLAIPPARRKLPIALYLIGYAVLRLFTETLRGDDDDRGFVIGPLSTSQAIALVILLGALGLMYRERRAQR